MSFSFPLVALYDFPLLLDGGVYAMIALTKEERERVKTESRAVPLGLLR